MPRGGKRPGAGLKKGWKSPQTLDKIALRRHIFERVAAESDAMISAQIAASKGLKYLVTRDKTGKFVKVTEAMAGALQGYEIIEVWEKEPSTPAFADLMNRAADKPKEQDIDVNVNVTNTYHAKIAHARKRLKS